MDQQVQKLGWLQPGMGSLASTPPMHLGQRRQSQACAMVVPPVLLILLLLVAITSIPLFLALTSRIFVIFGFNKVGGYSEVKVNLTQNASL